MAKKLIPVIACALIIGAAVACTKKEDPAIAALQAQMEAMQAELDKAKSTNASAEEIAQIETAIAEIAEQEQRAERRRGEGGRRNRDETPANEQETTAPTTTPTATTPAVATPAPAATPAPTTTTTVPSTTASASTSRTTSARSLEDIGTIANGHLTFHNGVTDTIVVIGDDAVTAVVLTFANNQSITRVTMPNSVKTVAGFQGCTNLTSVTFGSGVEGIMDQAFWNCKLGPSLTVPNGVVFIGTSAFENNQLTSVTLPNSLRDLGGFQENRLTSITIPNSIDRILDAAFRNNRLTGLVIPNSVTSIGRYAFENNQITHVTIPASVTSISYCAFTGNPLRSVTFERSGVQISVSAQQLQQAGVFGYAFDDGESLLEAYTQGGAGTYIYDSLNAGSIQTRTGQTILFGGNWTKQIATRVVSYDKTTANTNLYAEPSANAKVIRPINAGETVTVLVNIVGTSSSPITATDSAGQTWKQVEYGGDEGWVREDYFSGK